MRASDRTALLVKRLLRRPRKLKGANLPHPHFHYRRPRHRQRFRHHRIKVLSPLNAPRLKANRLRQQGKVRRMQFVIVLTPAKLFILNTTHYAVAAVVHDQQRHVGFLLRQRRQLA